MILWDEVGEAEGHRHRPYRPRLRRRRLRAGQRAQPAPRGAPWTKRACSWQALAGCTGTAVAEVAAPIFEDLERKGMLYRVEPYTHRYPICWRCKTELVFRLVDEWFISMGELYDKPREELTA